MPDFAQIVREHQAMVFSCAYHYLHDRALAEEVAQDVFLELHRSIAPLESPDHIRNWLRRVAVHRSIDQARRRNLRPRHSLEEVAEPASPSRESDPLLDAVLRRMVASLPGTARMVVVLRYQEDLDPMEIAEILGMPVSTVKSHLQRALALLRGKMARTVGEIKA